MNELVSILIPVYNAERWLAETLECAVEQTWTATEVIVVDDGSTDESLRIAQGFASPQVRVVSQQNSGAPAARNRAFRLAQGEFIQYLDADDLLSPDKVERQVRLLQEHPPGYLAVCDTIHFFDGEETEIPATGWPAVDADDPLEWLIDLMGPNGRGGMIPLHVWLTPRVVAEVAGPWDEQLTLDQDGEYFARVVISSEGIRRAEGVYSFYRKYRDESNVSGRRTREAHRSALRATDSKAKQILTKVDGRNKAKARRALAHHYQKRAFLAYPSYPDITATAELRAEKLGGSPFTPMQHSWKARTVHRLLGWKASRLLQYWYRRLLGLLFS